MIPLPGTGTDPEEPTVDDEELRSLLKRYAYSVFPQTENEMQVPAWARGEGWSLRGAILVCAAFLILGVIAGRNSESARFDAPLLAALAYATPWQLFIMAPTFSGDKYVVTE